MRYLTFLLVLFIGCSSGGGDSSLPITITSAFRNSGEVIPSDEIIIKQLDAETYEVSVSTVGTNRISFSIAISADERIYGLTERLRDSAQIRSPGPLVEDLNPPEAGGINRRGEVVEMYIRPTFSLYSPFYHSSRGYGLWVDSSFPGSFDVGASDPNQLTFGFDTEGDSFRFLVFLGPSHKDILRQYHLQTGFPVRFPDWAFLHWRWRDTLPAGQFSTLDGTTVNAKVAEDVLQYEAFGIPSGVYLFDRPYLEGSDDPDSGGFGNFNWDLGRIPNPTQTLDSLRSRGFRAAVWIASWAQGENGQEARALGYQAPGGSRVIDFTNPAARQWWQGKLSSFFTAYGIEAVKLDRGEEFTPSSPSDVWADGRRGVEIHNLFPVLQAEVTSSALRAATGSSAVLARAGFSGSQAYVGNWGGDTPGGTDLGLRMAIIKLQRAAFLGFPTWGSDTGGYFSFTNREVFARWLQFSALCPIMEIGGQGSHAPWDMPTTPRFDEQMIEIYRRYVVLHHELNPYISRLADEATASGTPMARSMIIEFPNDLRFLDTWDQYMFGPDYLVAPVWRVGQRSRNVLLPEGRWEWYWDRTQVFQGPGEIAVDAPLDTLPLFVRG